MADAIAAPPAPLRDNVTPSAPSPEIQKLDTASFHNRIWTRFSQSRVYQQLVFVIAPTHQPGTRPDPAPRPASLPLQGLAGTGQDKTVNIPSSLNGQHHDSPDRTERPVRQPSGTQQSSQQKSTKNGDGDAAGLGSGFQPSTRKRNPSSGPVNASCANPSENNIPPDEGIEGPAVKDALEEIPFSKQNTQLLSGNQKRYMDMVAEIREELNREWKTEVKGRLDAELGGVIKGKRGRDEIYWITQFYMVGVRHEKANKESVLLAEPTIVITCGSRDCKSNLEKMLDSIKTRQLPTFDHPILVHYKRQPPAKWTTSLEGETSSNTSRSRVSTLQDVCIEQSELQTISGLKMQFHVLQAGILQQRYATLGGVLSLDEAMFVMTTAHTFLVDGHMNDPLASEDIDNSDESSNFDDDVNSSENRRSSTLSASYNAMEFASIWRSNVDASMTYSFLGEVVTAGGFSSFHPPSSDWALFEVLSSHPLSSKLAQSAKTTSILPALQLTAGLVQILDRVNTNHTGRVTQTSVSIRTGQAVIEVREILLSNRLSPGSSGAWVMRESKVCGYVVAESGSGRSCFMITMEHSIDEMEKVSGKKVKFGHELRRNSSREANRRSAWQAISLPMTSIDSISQPSVVAAHIEIQPPEDLHTTPSAYNRENTSAWTPIISRLSALFTRRSRPLPAASDRDSSSRQYSIINPREPVTINPDVIPDIEEALGDLNSASGALSTMLMQRARFESDVRISQGTKNVKRWSPAKKRLNICIILTNTFFYALVSTLVAPSVSLIMRDFHSSSHVAGNFVISFYVLGQVAGPLLLMPLSDSYGRYLVYHISNISFVAFNIACALAPSTATLIFFRFLAGCGAACPVAVGLRSIEDMYLEKKEYQRLERLIRRGGGVVGPNGIFIFRERGQAVAALTIASLLGSSIGPVPGGYLVEHANWHIVFWAVVGFGVLLEFGGLSFLSETNERIISHRARNPEFRNLRWSLASIRNALRSWLLAGNPITTSFSRAIKRPSALLKSSKTATRAVFSLALMKGFPFLFYTMLTTIFTPGYTYATRWSLSPGKSGLTFLAIFIGNIIGSLIGYVLFQWTRKRIDMKMLRKERITVQQLALFAGSLIVCSSVVGFGWSVTRAKQFILVLVAPYGAGLGISLTVLTIEAFLLDSMVFRDSADALSASIVLGSLAGGLLPFIAQLLSDVPALGIKWTYTIFGIFAIAILETAWHLWRKGRRVLYRESIEISELGGSPYLSPVRLSDRYASESGGSPYLEPIPLSDRSVSDPGVLISMAPIRLSDEYVAEL